MADTPQAGETTTPPVVPENNDGSASAPAGGNANDEAAQLRKELEQAKMRANQLENEKAKRDKAEEEARRKSLEEQNEYKTLFEKTDAELKAIREREERQARETELAKVSEGVLKDYPKEVQELAETAGLKLEDESEVSRAAFKEKLDAIAKRVVPQQTSNSNNPSNLPTPNVEQSDLPEELRPTEKAEFTGKGGRVVTEMAFAGARNDPSVVRSYIRKLDAVEQMRKDSGYTRTEV